MLGPDGITGNHAEMLDDGFPWNGFDIGDDQRFSFRFDFLNIFPRQGAKTLSFKFFLFLLFFLASLRLCGRYFFYYTFCKKELRVIPAPTES